jgi:hypothetical protein
MVMGAMRRKMKGFDITIDVAAIILVFILIAFIVLYVLSTFKLI